MRIVADPRKYQRTLNIRPEQTLEIMMRIIVEDMRRSMAQLDELMDEYVKIKLGGLEK